MKKKYVLKKWVKPALLTTIVILAIVVILALDGLTPEQEESINNCMDQGYSREYCEKGLLGY